MNVPSSFNFWESNLGKGLIGLGKGIAATGAGLFGTHQMHTSGQRTHHKAIKRTTKRVLHLNESKINPPQYVLEASHDGVPSHKIKSDLVAWGRTWNGVNFSNPEAFDVIDDSRSTHSPVSAFFGFKSSYCTLKEHPLDLPTTKRKKRSMSVKSLGLRGGGAKDMEVQDVTEDGIDMLPDRYEFNPALANEISEEEIEAVPDRPLMQTYSFRRPSSIPPMISYGLTFVLIIGSTLVVSYVQRRFGNWLDSQYPQKSAPTPEKNGSFETPGSELGEKRMLDTQERSSTKARHEFLLEIFLAYKKKLISRKKAAYILVKYYNLSEIEALELLDDS